MRVIGVEFAGSDMLYVVLDRDTDKVRIVAANRLSLSDTRRRQDVAAFYNALTVTLNEYAADLVAIKLKPETGRMRAGAAALKMEALLLATAHADVEFVSGARMARVESMKSTLHAYLQNALRTGLAALANHV